MSEPNSPLAGEFASERALSAEGAIFSANTDAAKIKWLCILSILLISILNCFFSAAPGESLQFVLKIGAWMAAFVLGASSKDKETREIIVQTFIIGGIAACAVGYLFWIGEPATSLSLASTFYESDVFAGYLLLLFPLALNLAFFGTDRNRRILYGLVSILFLVSLFFTYSRGAWLVLIVIVLIWLSILSRRKRFPIRSILVLSAAALFVSFIGLAVHRNEPLALNFWSKLTHPLATAGARLSFWKGALEIFIRHPLMGSGLDTFGRFFPQFQERFIWYSRYPHNFYLQLLSDGGIVLAVPFFVLIFIVLRSGIKQLNDETDFGISLGLFLGFLAGLFHLFIDVDSNFLLWSILFWGIGGLLMNRLTNSAPVLAGIKWDVSLFIGIGLMAVMQTANFYDQKARHEVLQGRLEKAAVYEKKAMRFFPLESAYPDRLYGITRDPADLRHAIRLDPKKALYWDELGDYENASGKPEDAIALYKQALELDPLNYPDIRTSLAGIALKMNQLNEAKTMYEDVVKFYPDDQIDRLAPFRKENFIRALIFSHLGLAQIARRENNAVLADAETKKALWLIRQGDMSARDRSPRPVPR